MSSTPARCEHKRIHRDHTDIDRHYKCKVENIPMWTPKPKNTTNKTQTSQPAPPKRGRGRPRKQNLTPPQEDQDQIDYDDTNGFPSSPLASFARYPLRALGSLFTPKASQQEPAAMPESESPATDDGEAPSSPDGLRYTPGGNPFVPETPLDDMPAPAGDDGSVFDGMLSAPNPHSAPGVDTSVLAAWRHDVVQYENEINHLQRVRARVVEELADKDFLAKCLRTRNLIHEATEVVTKTELDQSQRERDAADEHARQARRQAEQVKLHLGLLVVLLVLLMVAYALWCWYRSPEMEYIRQRRVAVLRE